MSLSDATTKGYTVLNRLTADNKCRFYITKFHFVDRLDRWVWFGLLGVNASATARVLSRR